MQANSSCTSDQRPPQLRPGHRPLVRPTEADTYVDTRYLQLTGPNGPFLLPPRCLLTAGYPACADRCVPYRAAPLDEAYSALHRQTVRADRLSRPGRYGFYAANRSSDPQAG